jgi:hypothetical protein
MKSMLKKRQTNKTTKKATNQQTNKKSDKQTLKEPHNNTSSSEPPESPLRTHRVIKSIEGKGNRKSFSQSKKGEQKVI